MVTWTSEVPPAGRHALIDAARESLLLRPDSANNWLALGRLLFGIGRVEEAAEVLNEAAARLPAEAKIHLLLADAHRQIGKLEAALNAAETALSLAPDDQTARLKRFDLFVKAESWDRVTQDLHYVATAAPARRSLMLAQAHFARKGGSPEDLLAACEAALVRQAGNTEALHHKAVALSMLGRNDEACFVMGLDTFVSVAELPVRDEPVCDGTFLHTLATEILHNPTLIPDPHGKSTREGLQTRALLQPGDRAVPLLLEQIKLAVERYVEALPAVPHPFATERPARVRLNAWAVVYPQDGRQSSHFHPAGWISGVTYVTAPRVAGASNYRGPLVLGEIAAARHTAPPPWGTREVEPVPGSIVLFPSFVPHATRPTGLPEQRICIAFDVEPA